MRGLYRAFLFSEYKKEMITGNTTHRQATGSIPFGGCFVFAKCLRCAKTYFTYLYTFFLYTSRSARLEISSKR